MEKQNQPPEFEPLSRMQVLTAMGVTALVLLVIATLWRRLFNIPLLSWEMGVVPILTGIAVGLGITAASSLVYFLWPACRRSADLYMRLVLEPLTWPDLIWLGLLPGLSEELLFRGVMLPALGGGILGLILSSLCFGVLHLSSPSQWSYIVWACVVGLILGYSALGSNNLLVPILAHITANLVSGCLWKGSHPDVESG